MQPQAMAAPADTRKPELAARAFVFPKTFSFLERIDAMSRYHKSRPAGSRQVGPPLSEPPLERTEMRRHIFKRRAAYVESFRRVDCARCGLPVMTLGEAVGVDCAEGRFVVIHVCLPCVRGRALQAERGEEVRAA